MPEFKYVATDDQGNRHKGVLDVADETRLQLQLKAEELYLVRSRRVAAGKGRQLKPAVLADFSRQLGSLIGAGVTLVRAIAIIADEDGLKPQLRTLYLDILKLIRQGLPLSDAMAEQGAVFPPLMIHMFRSAEASGTIEVTARKMAEHYDKDSRLNAKVKSSMTYPKILAVLIVVVVAVIMGFVMPQFSELFALMDTLPFATRALFALSDAVKYYWWLIIAIVAIIIVAGRIVFRIPKVRVGRDQLILTIPKVGKLMKTIYTARFARTLSSLYSCGIPITSALQIARKVIGNAYIEQQFDEVIPLIRSGRPLSEGLAQIDGFVKKLPASVRVGEESGDLEGLLLSMADNFDFEAETSLNKLVSYLEPAMIVVMAIIVGFIMYGVIMPIYNSYSAIG